MADTPDDTDAQLLPDITETILQPRTTRIQLGPSEPFPQLFTFTGEDVLELTSFCAVSGVTIQLAGRIRRPNGQVQVFKSTFSTNSARTATTNIYTLPDGDLLNCFLICSTGTPSINQVYVVLRVRRGAGQAFERLGTLIQGPVTATIGRAWPGSVVASVFDTPATPRIISGTSPGANNPILETVPTGAIWEIVNFFAPFTYVAGTLSSFLFALELKTPGAVTLGKYRQNAAFGSNTNGTITWGAAFTPTNAAVNDQAGALPAGILLPGGSTLNVGAAIGVLTWTTPVYVVREYFDI